MCGHCCCHLIARFLPISVTTYDMRLHISSLCFENTNGTQTSQLHFLFFFFCTRKVMTAHPSSVRQQQCDGACQAALALSANQKPRKRIHLWGSVPSRLKELKRDGWMEKAEGKDLVGARQPGKRKSLL